MPSHPETGKDKQPISKKEQYQQAGSVIASALAVIQANPTESTAIFNGDLLDYVSELVITTEQYPEKQKHPMRYGYQTTVPVEGGVNLSRFARTYISGEQVELEAYQGCRFVEELYNRDTQNMVGLMIPVVDASPENDHMQVDLELNVVNPTRPGAWAQSKGELFLEIVVYDTRGEIAQNLEAHRRSKLAKSLSPLRTGQALFHNEPRIINNHQYSRYVRTQLGEDATQEVIDSLSDYPERVRPQNFWTYSMKRGSTVVQIFDATQAMELRNLYIDHHRKMLATKIATTFITEALSQPVQINIDSIMHAGRAFSDEYKDTRDLYAKIFPGSAGSTEKYEDTLLGNLPEQVSDLLRSVEWNHMLPDSRLTQLQSLDPDELGDTAYERAITALHQRSDDDTFHITDFSHGVWKLHVGETVDGEASCVPSISFELVLRPEIARERDRFQEHIVAQFFLKTLQKTKKRLKLSRQVELSTLNLYEHMQSYDHNIYSEIYYQLFFSQLIPTTTGKDGLQYWKEGVLPRIVDRELLGSSFHYRIRQPVDQESVQSRNVYERVLSKLSRLPKYEDDPHPTDFRGGVWTVEFNPRFVARPVSRIAFEWVK